MLQDTKKNESQLYFWLMVLVVLLGFGLRIAKLGILPLNNAEAALALNVDLVARGEETEITQTLYTTVTGALFWLFEAGNGIARLLPLLAGTMLIFLPWMLGDLFSDRVKLLMSFGLALDPALMAASKTAGSHMIAVLSLWLVIAFFLKKKPLWTGIAFSPFFMSGVSFLLGGIIFGLTLLWLLLRDPSSEAIKTEIKNFNWKTAAAAFAVSFILIASALFTNPAGIGAVFQDILVAFSISANANISLGLGAFLIAFFVYEFFPLLLGVLRVIKLTDQDSFSIRAFAWAGLVALIVVVLNPGRAALDLIWVSVPLWMLAAQQLDKIIENFREFNLPSAASGLFFLLLIGFMFFNAVGAVNIEYTDRQQLLIRFILLGGSAVLIAITYFLITYSWGEYAAKNALIVGLGVFLFCFGLLMPSWFSAFLGDDPQNELWHQSASFVDAQRLLETVEDLAEMNHGQRIDQSIVLLDVDAPAVQWQLRDQEVVNTNVLVVGESPEMLLTPLTEPQLWGAEYTGQDFRIGVSPNWSWLNFREWMHWIIFHEVSINTEEWRILWVRTDLFPGQSAAE